MVQLFEQITLIVIVLVLVLSTLLPTTLSIQRGYKKVKYDNEPDALTYFHIDPSIRKWDTIETNKKFSILSMAVEHSSEGNWYIRNYHDKYSVGYNRTIAKGFLNRPIACNIRFFAIGLEKTLEGFQGGGVGHLAIGFENKAKKKFWHGFDKNETNKLYCYYSTNKDTGSEFLVSTT